MRRLLLTALFASIGVLDAGSVGARSYDLLFLVDETSGMAAEIASLKASAVTTIAPVALSALGDVAFGVAGYRDFPVAPFGDPSDFSYRMHSQIDTSFATFQAGMNALSAAGGGDAPESGLHALSAAAIPSAMSPSWRAGSIRVILWIGDAPSHDGSLEPAYASCCSSTGVSGAIAALKGSGIAVFAISTDPAGLDATGQASAVTAATAGTLSQLPSSVGLAQTISQLLQGPIASWIPVPTLSPLGLLVLAAAVATIAAFAAPRFVSR